MKRILLFLILLCTNACADTPAIIIQEANGTNAGRYRVLKVSNGTTTNNNDGSVTINTGAGTITASDTGVVYSDGANSPTTDVSNFYYNKTTHALTVGSLITATSNTPQTDYYPTQVSDTHWTAGVNADGGNDNDDNWTLSEGTTLGSSNRITVAPGGLVTIPSATITTITGHTTIEGITPTGATGTGQFVFDTAPSMSSVTTTTYFKLPQGTGPTVDAAGKTAIDTTNDQLAYYGGAKRIVSYIHSKSFVIDTPTASSDYIVWRAPYAVTITAIHVLCSGGTNIIGGLDEGDSNGANIVAVDADITSTAGSMAADDGSLTNPTIASGGTVNWHTTSISSTPTSAMVTFEYQIDAT